MFTQLLCTHTHTNTAHILFNTLLIVVLAANLCCCFIFISLLPLNVWRFLFALLHFIAEFRFCFCSTHAHMYTHTHTATNNLLLWLERRQWLAAKNHVHMYVLCLANFEQILPHLWLLSSCLFKRRHWTRVLLLVCF